jgi:hypothetical protein
MDEFIPLCLQHDLNVTGKKLNGYYTKGPGYDGSKQLECLPVRSFTPFATQISV